MDIVKIGKIDGKSIKKETLELLLENATYTSKHERTVLITRNMLKTLIADSQVYEMKTHITNELKSIVTSTIIENVNIVAINISSFDGDTNNM